MSRARNCSRVLTMCGMTAPCFIFLQQPTRVWAYVRQVAEAVKAGGHVIISTFGPEGPTQCSGLDVVRYNAESLHEGFGVRFQLPGSSTELYQVPFGTTQQFVYCFCGIELSTIPVPATSWLPCIEGEL